MDKRARESRANGKGRWPYRTTATLLVLAEAIILVVFPLGFSTLPAAAKLRARQRIRAGKDGHISGNSQAPSRFALMNFADLARKAALNPSPREEPRLIREPEEEGFEKGPISDKAKVFAEVRGSHAPKSLGPSPALSASFQGSPGPSGGPPDTQGAAGPNHLMVVLNAEVRVQDKSGATLGVVRSLSDFFSPLASDSLNAFDPQLQFDPYGGRWILVAGNSPFGTDGSLLIGVSKTSDPTGDWKLFSFNADSEGKFWLDHPVLGFNKNWIVVSASMIPIESSGSVHADVFALNKSALYSAGPGSFLTRFRLPDEASLLMRPATTLDSSLDTMYLIQYWLGNSNGSGSLRLYSITGPVGSEVLNNVGTPVFITTTDTWNNGGMNGAPQLGSSERLPTGNPEINSVIYRNGSLWCVHTINLPADGEPTRSALQWWEISPNGTVMQRGRVEDPSGNVFYGFPSIAVNSNNDVLIGYARFTATAYAGSGYVFRAGSDPQNSMRDDTVLKTGESPYFSNRWGDYSETVVDPANDVDMWTTQEYAAPVLGGHATWWGRISPPASMLTRNLTVASSNPASGVTITVSPNDINNQNSGATPFARNYNNNASVSLTATATAQGNNFQKWQRDGSDWSTNLSTIVAMDANHVMTAVYFTPNFVQFNAESESVSETLNQTTSVNFTVTRMGAMFGAASVSYATSNATATDRSDYLAALGTVNFAPGETSKTFPVFIVDDRFGEGAETFSVILSNPVGCTLGSPSITTVTINSNETVNGLNPVKDASFNSDFFVREHYVDFFNREADASGLAFWKNQIDSCTTQACREIRRINVSAAFFVSIEFQETGYLVERLYKTAYGSAVGTSTLGGTHQLSVPVVRLHEFLADTQQIGRGVIIGQAGADQTLENNKQILIAEFVQRLRFLAAFPPSMTSAQFVDQLNANTGGVLSPSERNQLVNDLASGAKTRAQVLRAVAEDSDLYAAEINRAFVLAQFFGYLRRNPNDSPDSDYTGYDFWLGKLNQFNGNFVNAEMVKAFIVSGEYQLRFGP